MLQSLIMRRYVRKVGGDIRVSAVEWAKKFSGDFREIVGRHGDIIKRFETVMDKPEDASVPIAKEIEARLGYVVEEE